MNAEPDDDRRGQRHRDGLRQPEVAGGQRDADELGDDRQRVEQEQVDDAERAPEPAEPLQDQPRVPDAGDRAEPEHHLLVHVEHRHQQQQGPQQVRAVVLARLAVGGERPRVVVADHHDQPGTDDRQQRLEGGGQAAAGGGVLQPDGAQRAADVADVLGVEHRAAGLRRGHGDTSLCPGRASRRHAASVRAALGRSRIGSRGKQSAQGGRLPRAGRKRGHAGGGPMMARTTFHVSPPPAVTHGGVRLSMTLSCHPAGTREDSGRSRDTPTRQSFGTTRRSARGLAGAATSGHPLTRGDLS